MTKPVKWISFVVFSGLFLSGILYAIPTYAEEYSTLEVPNLVNRLTLMSSHGVFAMVSYFLFGIIFQSHIKKKIGRNEKRIGGLCMVLTFSILGLTGVVLYYSGSDLIRRGSSVTHTVLGAIFFGIFLWHSFRKGNRE